MSIRKRIFLDKANIGWWTPERSKKADVPFNVIIGGRGIGKTYGILKEFLTDESRQFMYARRTERAIHNIVNPAANPFKSLNRDLKREIIGDYSASVGLGTFCEHERQLGYAAAVSVSGNQRGADFWDVSHFILDEAVPQANERVSAKEADAFFNFYETINRNRELVGEKPVKAYLCSNSQTITAPIYVGLGIVGILENMRMTRQQYYTDKERGIHIEYIRDSPVSQAKAQTALYRATEGTSFYSHAIENDFSYDNFVGVERRKIVEYAPIVSVSGITLYQHKTGGHYYFTTQKANVSDISEKLFKMQYLPKILALDMRGKVFYESYECKKKILTM